ncbi:hypothetical protein FXO38_07151 [Capsicum annuum]|nr:hypothetical protein FXO38_07151 [Capsicum annuum]
MKFPECNGQRTEDEVNRMNIMEKFRYAVVSKFSYGWSEMNEHRSKIPNNAKLRDIATISLLMNRHILIRFDREKDFVNMLSKNVYYFLDKEGIFYPKRLLIYDAKFKVKEETTQILA